MPSRKVIITPLLVVELDKGRFVGRRAEVKNDQV